MQIYVTGKFYFYGVYITCRKDKNLNSRKEYKMQVQRISGSNTSFNGFIQDSGRIRQAIDIAVTSDKKTAKQFFNTLREIKNDGTNRTLKIESYFSKNRKIHTITTYGDKKISGNGLNPLNDVISIGKEVFGEKALNKKTKEPELAKKAYASIQQTLDVFYETFIKCL